MAAGNGVNCKDCIEFKKNRCDGHDERCFCYKCPRRLAECMCAKYCRETESVLYFDEEE